MKSDCHCKLLICTGQAEGQTPGHAEKEAVQAETDGTQVTLQIKFLDIFTFSLQKVRHGGGGGEGGEEGERSLVLLIK